MTDTVSEEEIWKLYSNWKKAFQTACKKKPPEAAAEVAGQEESTLVKDQVQFIEEMISNIIIDGATSETFDRVRDFLLLQTYPTTGAHMEFHFIGGSPVDVFLFADSIDDIDIADAYSLTLFDLILVTREHGKDWDKKAAEAIIEQIYDDLSFDFDEVSISYDLPDPGLLEIDCQID